MLYEKIQSYYQKGLWSRQRVEDAAGRVLTQEEVQSILQGELTPPILEPVEEADPGMPEFVPSLTEGE